jgi:rhodanese-related sulfurtransferase
MHFRKILSEILLILGISLITALIVNHLSPRGIALFGEWDTSRGLINAKPNLNEFMEIVEIADVQEAKKIYDSKKAVFVDARSDDLYKQGHIKGALSLPLSRFADLIHEIIVKYPPGVCMIAYCSGRECDEGYKLAQHLQGAGYTNVRVLIDGLSGWESHGFPLE